MSSEIPFNPINPGFTNRLWGEERPGTPDEIERPGTPEAPKLSADVADTYMWRGERSKTPDNSADVLDEYRSIPQAPRGPKPKIDVMNSIKNMPPITPLMQRLGINPEDNSDGEF